MNKTDVLKTIQSAHTTLEELLAPLSETQFCTATLEGQRSIKDILAHIAAWGTTLCRLDCRARAW